MFYVILMFPDFFSIKFKKFQILSIQLNLIQSILG